MDQIYNYVWFLLIYGIYLWFSMLSSSFGENKKQTFFHFSGNNSLRKTMASRFLTKIQHCVENSTK